MELIPNAGLSLISLSRGVFGMFFLIFIAYLFSNNRKAIVWKTVGIGLIIQVFIAIGVLKINFVKGLFETIGGFFIKVLEYTGEGTKMLLGEFGDTETYGFIFVFQALPVIIFFSALSSILYYFGIIQKLVGFLAWGLTKIFKVSGAESLSVAGNIFLGQTEAPLLIKAYLEKMNRSEIFLVMVGGMATVAGSVLGAYIGFLGGDDPIMQLDFAKSLLAASVMAAPGAIVIAKIIYPQTEEIKTDISISSDRIGSNLLSAISIGTGEGIKMAVNVAAMFRAANGGFGFALGMVAIYSINLPSEYASIVLLSLGTGLLIVNLSLISGKIRGFGELRIPPMFLLLTLTFFAYYANRIIESLSLIQILTNLSLSTMRTFFSNKTHFIYFLSIVRIKFETFLICTYYYFEMETNKFMELEGQIH